MSELSPDRQITSAALTIFDQTIAAHRLPAWARRALALAAEASSAVRELPAENRERIARDMILADPAPRLEADQRAVAACAAIFQRPKLRSHREAAFICLSPRNQTRAMRLAAILQLARAVAQSSAAHLQIAYAEETTTLTLDGDVSNIAKQCTLWGDLLGPLVVHTQQATPVLQEGPAPTAWRALDEDSLPARTLVPVADQLSGEEPAGEGARRVLRRFFERMLAREDDVLKAEDAEDVHQMRVATRRLRASLQVVESIFERKAIRHYRRGLRRVAQSLGGVRDADVFLIALKDYRATLPAHSSAEIDPLIDAATKERIQARAAMLADLGAARYTRFKHALAIFLTSHDTELAPLPITGIPPRIRDLAGSVLWRRYEDLRAFEPTLSEASDATLHQARIAGKRLRYTLEFFADVLGPRVTDLLDQLATLQEHLGAIQDAATAHAHIARLAMGDDPGARAYIAHLAAHRGDLIAELPQVWGKVAGKTYQRKLFEAILKV